MKSSVRSRLEGSASTLLAKGGRFSVRVGGRLQRMSRSLNPWDEVSRSGAAGPESAVARAERLGYVCHGEFGTKLAYDAEVMSPQVVEKIERGGYERFEARRSRDLVKAGDRVIELGAGLGFLSALIVGQTDVGEYVMVEADPRLADVIRRTHELNGLPTPTSIRTCVATCDQDLLAKGEVEFHVGAKFCASSILGVRKRKDTVIVPVVPLVDVIEETKANVLLVDIEGAETGVFNGTPLGTVERIVMEIHPHRIGDAGVRKVFSSLDTLGFVYDASMSSGAVLGFHKSG